jgi:hypothetical protein
MSAIQEASRWAFSSAKEPNDGTGTRKLRRPKPTRLSTCPFSFPRATRQKWWSKRKWLSRRKNSSVSSRSRPTTFFTAILELS